MPASKSMVELGFMLSETEMLSWARQFIWIITDRVAEFDEIVRLPLERRDFVQFETHKYLKERQAIQPDGLAQDFIRPFSNFLETLSAGGEDIKKIHGWSLCMCTRLQPIEAQRSLIVLKETFHRFAKGVRRQAINLDDGFIDEIAASYAENVLQPSRRFFRECYETSETWLEREELSEFDEFVWEAFLEEGDIDPADTLGVGYSDMLAREWWRNIRSKLSNHELEAIHEEQVANIKEYGNKRASLWKTDGTVSNVAMLLGAPPFEKVTR